MLFDYCIMGDVSDYEMENEQLQKQNKNSIIGSEHFLVSIVSCMAFRDTTGVNTPRIQGL